jgi:hypothetical protein
MSCPRWPIAIVALSKPCERSWRSTISMMANSSPIGTSGLGKAVV